MRKIFRFIKNTWRAIRNELPELTVDECEFQTGDLLAFSGTGLFSWVIKVGTLSRISHVAVVLVEDGVPWICESTTLTTSPDGVTGEIKKGVQKHLLKNRVKQYDGEVYYYRLKKEYPEKAQQAIKEWCNKKHKGTGYDAVQAVISGFDLFDHIPDISEEDLEKLFCSEMYAKLTNIAYHAWHGYEPIANPSKENPAEVCDYEFLKLQGKFKI